MFVIDQTVGYYFEVYQTIATSCQGSNPALALNSCVDLGKLDKHDMFYFSHNAYHV